MEEIDEEELFFRIALTQTEHIGERMARLLLGRFQSAKAVFQAGSKKLASIEGLGEKRLSCLRQTIDEKRVADEIKFIRQHRIKPLFFTDTEYPARLKECEDAPMMLYYKGSRDLNQQKMVSVVGTRKNSGYGEMVTEQLVESLSEYPLTLVSGMAFGIDVIAHRKALQCKLPTIGVMAHGLDTIYPGQHRHIAREMIQDGGLITEYASGTRPDKFNFPMRNRIVAGMCDATIVVETEEKGGAMITAKLAASYNREVLAFPGRATDQKSSGCNYLIKTNIAQLITGAADLCSLLQLEPNTSQGVAQARLFQQLNSEEQVIAQLLGVDKALHIDELQLKLKANSSKLASHLLNMELNGFIKSLPGKRYRLVHGG
jgi:DNA processing protein